VVSLSGEVVEDRAELNVNARVVLRDDRWVRVPLRMDRAVLREPPKHADDAEELLHFDPESGYVWWLRGEAKQRRTISLKMSVPLTRVRERSRLELRVPRSTASELKLKVAVERAEAEVSDNATLLPPSAAGKGATLLTALGLGGQFELTWQPPGQEQAKPTPMLEATGATLVEMEVGAVRWTTTLSVRSFAAPFERFRVRLPAGASLASSNNSQVTIVPLNNADDDKVGDADKAKSSDEKDSSGDSEDASDETAAGRSVVEVRLEQPTSGPVEVRLSARRDKAGAFGAGGSPEWLELGGFEVLGAVRDRGSVAVAAREDLRVLWGPRRDVRRVEQLPDALRHDDLAAGFEYVSQPYSLQTRLVPRRTRVAVEPTYIVRVGASEMKLDARLGYVVRGAKVHQLTIALPDWELLDVGPSNVVAVDAIQSADDGRWIIPLLQPTGGELELTLTAVRPSGAQAEGAGDSSSAGDSDEDETEPRALYIPLPRPDAESPIAAAAVAIVPDDNVEIIPDAERSTGLLRQQTIPRIELPPHQQPALYYLVEKLDATFVGAMRVMPQEISVDGLARVSFIAGETATEAGDASDGADWQGGAIRVVDQLDYRIEHEPAHRFTLAAPRSIVDPQRLTITHKGEPLRWRVEDTASSEGLSENAKADSGQADRESDDGNNKVATPEGGSGDSSLDDREQGGSMPAGEAAAGSTAGQASRGTPSAGQASSGTGAAGRTGGDGLVRITALLPTGCIGECRLEVAYRVDLPPPTEAAASAATVDVPLVVPHGATLGKRLTLIDAGRRWSVAPIVDTSAATGWRNTIDNNRPSDGKRLHGLVSTTWRAPLRLSVSTNPVAEQGAVVVARAWVQTWLIRSEQSARQERAVFQFLMPETPNHRHNDEPSPSRQHVRVIIPRGAAIRRLSVWLDGDRVNDYAVDGQEIFVPLPPSEGGERHRLELSYHFPAPTSETSLLQLELPRLGEDTWIRRMYWQVILPRRQHVLLEPEGFTAESRWGFHGYLWSRRPLLEQPELEAWVGAARRTPVSQATNRYLFSTSGRPVEVELRTAGRAWIVLIASGLALVAGLLLIYVPAARHPGTLFAAAVVLVAAGLIYPEPTMLVAQAAVLGLGLTLLAGLLHRSMSRYRRPPIPERSSSVIEVSSTRTNYRRPVVADLQSTETAPAASPPPASAPAASAPAGAVSPHHRPPGSELNR